MSTKWTPERSAKFSATMKKKRASGWRPKPYKHKASKQPKQMPRVWQEPKEVKSNGHAVQDAIGWLRYADQSATDRLRAGTLKKYDESHHFMALALAALERIRR